MKDHQHGWEIAFSGLADNARARPQLARHRQCRVLLVVGRGAAGERDPRDERPRVGPARGEPEGRTVSLSVVASFSRAR
jgi:hypothetical protein